MTVYLEYLWTQYPGLVWLVPFVGWIALEYAHAKRGERRDYERRMAMHRKVRRDG